MVTNMDTMIDLFELIKKRPFIYFVRDDYYAFGSGVCKKCNDERGRFITLPEGYKAFQQALNKEEMTQKEAWDTYRRVNSIAETVCDEDDHMNLENKFEDLKFTKDEKRELQEQLEQLTAFYSKYRLGECACS